MSKNLTNGDVTSNGRGEIQSESNQLGVKFSLSSFPESVDENVKQPENVSSDHLSVFKKVCFGLGALAFQLYFAAIGVFSTVFLLDVAKLPPEKNIYILFVSRIVDAVTDPLYGYLINKTKITRFGKMMPWIAISTPLSALSYLMMWYVPQGFSENQLFVWFLFWHSAVFTFTTGNRIPHMSMTMFLSPSLKQRESATVFRMALEMAGVLMALGIQGPLVGLESKDCEDELASSTASQMSTQQTTAEPPAETIWSKNVYFFVAVILTFIWLVCNLLCVLFVSEDKDLLEASEKKQKEELQNINVFKELKRMFTFKPFILVGVTSVLGFSTVQSIQGVIQLYFEYSIPKLNSYFIFAIIGLLVCSILFVPLWQYLMSKFEKKYLVIAGNITLVPMLVALFFFEKDQVSEVVIFFVLIVIGSNCFTTVFVLPWAMLPEVLDEYFLEFKQKSDALFYTFFALGTKIIIAIYLAITQIVLSLVNFKNGECVQENAKGVSLAIKMLISPPQMLFLLISSICILFYPINSKRAAENSRKIKEFTKNKDERNEIGSVDTSEIPSIYKNFNNKVGHFNNADDDFLIGEDIIKSFDQLKKNNASPARSKKTINMPVDTLSINSRNNYRF